MVSTIYVLIGAPNSGKSEYSKYHCQLNPNLIRVNRDILRELQFENADEKYITALSDSIIEMAIEKGKDVIVDSTNLNKEYFDKFVNKWKYKANLKFKVFRVPYEELLRRNSKKQIPEKVIKRFYNICEEWIEQDLIPNNIDKVDEISEVKSLTQDNSLPNAIICDLDGTLALLNGRDPYDASSCENDIVNDAVLDIVKDNERVIFVSGRKDTHRLQTESWLSKVVPNNIKWELYMRKEDDNRRDSIIKKEIFEKFIKDKYYIKYVLDDRDQVVWMWRKDLGLTCLQVNFGNF